MQERGQGHEEQESYWPCPSVVVGRSGKTARDPA